MEAINIRLIALQNSEGSLLIEEASMEKISHNYYIILYIVYNI